MDARELRLGNYVQTNQGVFKISGIQNEGLWICPFLSNESFSPKKNDIKPIPITEEWLIRMGFEKQDGNIGLLPEFKWPNNFYYTLNEYVFKGSTLTIDYGNDHFFDIQNVKYVHQLQNVYRYLTGEELEIKE